MKKLISALGALVLCLGMVSVRAQAAPAFSDLDGESAVGQAVEKMVDAGIINGFPDGTFRANANLTRAEFVKIVNLTFGLQLSDESTQDFADVAKSHWAYSQIKIARKAGYIQGVGENCFLPEGVVTRQEVCLMVGRIQNFQNLTGFPVQIQDPVSDWAKEAVENAVACGLFTLPEDGTFRATEPITRGEVCVALAQYAVSGGVSGGGTGSGNASGGVTDPGGDGSLTEEEKEEARVAGYIQKMLDSYARLKPRIGDFTTSKTVIANMDLLMNCMQEAMNARNGGVFLTREYIDETFASEIKTFKDAYGALSRQEVTECKTIVASLAYTDEIEAVMDYFGVSLS